MDTKPTNNGVQHEVKKQPNTVLKVIVLLALIALLIVGILLPIKLVPNAVTSVKNGFSSLFGKSQTITMKTDKSPIVSGEAFNLSWNGTHRNDGSYTLSYTCTPGVHIVTSIAMPNEIIACDTTYYFTPSTNSIELAINSVVNRISDVTITLGFLSQDASTSEVLAHIDLTVNNASASGSKTPIATSTATTSKPVVVKPVASTTPVKPATPTAPVVTRSNTVSNPQGTADLVVRIIDVGYINANGAFISSPSVSSNQRAAVRFSVSNNGTKNTGVWNMKADLPTAANPVYIAYNQPNLGPQDGIVYTLGFDRINNTQSNLITITVDHNNSVHELSEANNTSAATIVNNQGSYHGNNNSGKADLALQVIRVGYINERTNTFSEATRLNSGDTATVKFEVANTGTKATGSWEFTADLPTSGRNTFYTSSSQRSLNPGERMILTVQFEVEEDYGNEVTIDVDSSDDIDESNERNNTKTATITIY